MGPIEISLQKKMKSNLLRHPLFARLKQVLFLIIAGAVCILAAENPVGEKEKIEALIKQIENLKDAVFIRNGSNYDSKTAAIFLRGKWEKHTKEIKNATEFIEKLASNSSTSGKPYVIRFKDGREIKCGDYLKAELKKSREAIAKKPATQ